MTATFWAYDPYDTHYSVAANDQRTDYTFRVEFNDDVDEPARLTIMDHIAAAPKMLEMLEYWVEFCDLHKVKDANGNDLPIQVLTKELITKAREASK